MAFSYSFLHMLKIEGGDVEIGTFTNDSTAGGTVVTKLKRIDMAIIQPLSSSVKATNVSINESFPLYSGSFRVVTPSDSDTYLYIAIGGQ